MFKNLHQFPQNVFPLVRRAWIEATRFLKTSLLISERLLQFRDDGMNELVNLHQHGFILALRWTFPAFVAPVPTFLRRVAAINFKMSWYCPLNCQIVYQAAAFPFLFVFRFSLIILFLCISSTSLFSSRLSVFSYFFKHISVQVWLTKSCRARLVQVLELWGPLTCQSHWFLLDIKWW